MLTPEQKAHVLRELRANESMTEACKRAGVHRPHAYRDGKRDPAWWAQVEEAQHENALKTRDPLALSTTEILAFCKTLKTTGRLDKAVRAARLSPDQVASSPLHAVLARFSERPMNKRSRAEQQLGEEYLGRLCALLADPAPEPKPPIAARTEQAYEGWKAGRCFDGVEIDRAYLAWLSPRAAADYDRELAEREADQSDEARAARSARYWYERWLDGREWPTRQHVKIDDTALRSLSRRAADDYASFEPGVKKREPEWLPPSTEERADAQDEILRQAAEHRDSDDGLDWSRYLKTRQ